MAVEEQYSIRRQAEGEGKSAEGLPAGTDLWAGDLRGDHWQ